jgi:tetratricopeptide (TPR) repeat protein
MNLLRITGLAIACVLWGSCQQESTFQPRIDALEQRLAAQYTPERSDSLVNLYREAVKAHPDDHATNLRYLTRAAEVQFTLRQDGVAASRWLADALDHHAEGQDRAATVGLLTRIWTAHLYKRPSAIRLDPKDLDQIKADLNANRPWMDSALIRLDRQMTTNGVISNPELAGQFIEISEGAALTSGDQKTFTDHLLRAAGVAKNVENYNKAIQLYFKISDRLPDQPEARTALFMQGFIYENDVRDLSRAKTTYEDYLRRYPHDTIYGDDVRMALKHLGKSPEELIKEFEKQQQ